MFDTTKEMLYITRKQFNNGNIKISCKKNFKKLKNSEFNSSSISKKFFNLSKEERINLETGEIEKRLHSLESAKDSAHRAKNTLLDIIMSNDFDYFVALTFDNTIVGNRLDDKVTRKTFRKWAKSVKRKFPYMTYAAVPEYHGKGGLHFHMLIGCEPIYEYDSLEVKEAKKKFNLTNALKLINSGNVCASFMPAKNCKKVYFDKVKDRFELTITDGLPIYNITAWDYGFSTASQVLNKEAVKHYLTDYITKGHIDERFYSKKRFFCSQNILRPHIEKQSVLVRDNIRHNNIVTGYEHSRTDQIIEKEDFISKDIFMGVEFEDKEKDYIVFNSDKQLVEEYVNNALSKVTEVDLKTDYEISNIFS